MAIVETKILIRPSVSVLFFNQTNNPLFLAVKESMGTFTTLSESEHAVKNSNASGSYIVERTYSEDLLTQTSITTFNSMETWSTVDSRIGIALDSAYHTYIEENEFVPPTGAQYTVTGINAPFTCTTTYNYDSNTTNGYPLFDSFINVIEASDKLTNFTNTGTQLIAVHTYNNAEDFSENHWKDFRYTPSLNTGGVTRTIAYALV